MMRKGWSIESRDWEQLTRALEDAGSWQSVLLTPNDETMVPTRPGVYAICAKPPNALGAGDSTVFHSLASPLYVGKAASSIRSRFRAHCRGDNPELRRAKQCYRRVSLRFWFIELPTAAVADAEACLIDCFGPPVNQRRGTISGRIGRAIQA